MVVDDSETENISKIVDVNEIKLETSVPIIAAVEQCHSNKSAITSQSHGRTNWNESFSVPQSYCTWDKLECSGKPGPIQYQTGDTVASIEAVNNPQLQIDVRRKTQRTKWTKLLNLKPSMVKLSRHLVLSLFKCALEGNSMKLKLLKPTFLSRF